MKRNVRTPTDIASLVRSKLNSCGGKEESGSLKDALNNLTALITRTALQGESNSVLVIGPQGAGKSRLMKLALEKLNDNPEIGENLIQVHLNGLLLTDDRIALKEITRQLRLENVIGGRVFASFAENLRFLLESLKEKNEDSKSVLFVLDEFDLFCHHKNQTLLYNLFDVSQSAQTPIAVVGLTCRLDVIELLEKRVKSRFSHRQIHIFPANTFQEYIQIAVDLLSLLPNEHNLANEWNNSVKKTFKDKSVIDGLQRYFNVTKDIRSLKTLLFVAISSVNESDSTFQPKPIIDSLQLLTANSKATILNDLSVLELCLVIAMASLTIKYSGEPFNFQMVFEEYKTLGRNHSTVQTFNYSEVSKSFDHLKVLELVQPVSSTASGRVSSKFQLMILMLESSEVMDAVKSYLNLPTEVEQWASVKLICNV